MKTQRGNRENAINPFHPSKFKSVYSRTAARPKTVARPAPAPTAAREPPLVKRGTAGVVAEPVGETSEGPEAEGAEAEGAGGALVEAGRVE